jgi:hypothetical protein
VKAQDTHVTPYCCFSKLQNGHEKLSNLIQDILLRKDKMVKGIDGTISEPDLSPCLRAQQKYLLNHAGQIGPMGLYQGVQIALFLVQEIH